MHFRIWPCVGTCGCRLKGQWGQRGEGGRHSGKVERAGSESGMVTHRGSRNPRRAFGAKETSRSLHSGEGKTGPVWVRARPFHAHAPPLASEPHSLSPQHSPTPPAAPEARSLRRLPGRGHVKQPRLLDHPHPQPPPRNPPIPSPHPARPTSCNTYPLSILTRGPRKALGTSITLKNGPPGKRGTDPPTQTDTDRLQGPRKFLLSTPAETVSLLPWPHDPSLPSPP